MSASIKTADFWAVALCSLIDFSDWGKKQLRNVGKLLRDYLLQQLRRKPKKSSSQSSRPWPTRGPEYEFDQRNIEVFHGLFQFPKENISHLLKYLALG
jgi:hypothetical protein